MALTDIELLESKKAADGFWLRLGTSFASQGLFVGLALFYFAALRICSLFNPSLVERSPIATVIGMLCFTVPISIVMMILIL